MLPQRSKHGTAPEPAQTADFDTASFLNFLRFVALECRIKPRTDLFEACAMLQISRSLSLEAHAEALMRCLSEALGQHPIVRGPGTTETSFDEAWLVQLGAAFACDDQTSAMFLLRSRVVPEKRRLVGYLTRNVASFFPTV